MPRLYVKCRRCNTPYMMTVGSITLVDPVFVCIDCVEAITPCELLIYFNVGIHWYGQNLGL